MSIAERIKELLEQRGYGTQKELSQHIGIGQTTLNNWLKHNRSIPAEYVAGIADFFGVPVSYLLVGDKSVAGDFSARGFVPLSDCGASHRLTQPHALK